MSDSVWSAVISAVVVLLGIAASTWLGVASQTGPRRRVENIKLAHEALEAAADDSRSERVLHRFIAVERHALERQLDYEYRVYRYVFIVLGVLIVVIAVYNVLEELSGVEELLPGFRLQLGILGTFAFALGIAVYIIFWVGRRRRAKARGTTEPEPNADDSPDNP